MKSRDEDLYLAASMYYVQDETMESIARQLMVSRSTVSRLLKEARETGLVRITLAEPSGSRTALATTLSRTFGIQAHVVPVREGSSEVYRLDRVARVAGRLLSDMMADNMVLGLAWGTTLASVVGHLTKRDLSGTTVVQINGATNQNTSGIPYVGAIISVAAEAFGAEMVQFPVPTFFDFAETKNAMWRERSVQTVLELQKRIDIAVFGVGALEGSVPSHVYSEGYLDEADMAQIKRERVVGDVCTVFLREDGSYADVPLNTRASGLTPAELRRIPRRLCVVAGTAKTSPLLAALRARVMTDLVVDDATARAVLARL